MQEIQIAKLIQPLTLNQMRRMEFWTFLIKKNKNGKMGLWFVMISMPYMGNMFMVLKPVWRKIEKKGLPIDLGFLEKTLIKGEIKLLGLEDAGQNEILYISKVRKLGFVPSTVHWVPPNSREHFFSFLLRIRGNP
jgi:hypothetical protein